MEIKSLKTFIQVAERNSFTKAALALNYTQSTVSSQIKQLETELNVKLFERINHTVTLTQAGKALLERAHKIINLTEEVTSGTEEADIPASPVRFAMAPSVCSVMMGETYLNFHKMHPEVLVKIIEADTDSILQLMNQNDTDLVFIADRKKVNPDYITASEKRVAVHFAVSKSSPLSGRKNLSIEEVLSYPFLLSEKGLSYRRILEEKLAERNLSVTPIAEMGNTQLLLELVELGGGISFLPDYVTRKSYNEGRITYLDVKDFDAEIWCQLMYHKSKWLSPSMQKVINYCSKLTDVL